MVTWKKIPQAPLSLNSCSGRSKGYANIDGQRHVLVDHQSGWRPTIFAWMSVTVVVLLANITLLIWALAKPPWPLAPGYSESHGSDNSANTLFQGDCKKASKIKTSSHVVINILSSVLLMGSGNCMQCLSAPTRQEIDESHAEGRHLDIGILSARNLLKIPWKRSVPWLLLALSSMPLHFFYNSIIFSSLAANEILVFAVSNDFTTAESLNTSLLDGLNSTGYLDEQDELVSAEVWEQAARSLMPANTESSSTSQHLSRDECTKIFSPIIVSGYSSVALVLSLSNSSQILDIMGPLDIGTRGPWTCYNPNTNYRNTSELLASCEHGNGWESLAGYKVAPVLLPDQSGLFESCYVESGPELCSVELSPGLLGIVVVANFVKFAVMLYTWRYLSFTPLVTLGDAIDTFMCRPDQATAGAGPRSGRDFKVKLELAYEFFLALESKCAVDRAEAWKQNSTRWASAASKTRWICSLGLCITLEITAGILLFFSLQVGTFTESRQAGFGGIDPTFASTFESDTNIVRIALISNLPQMVVSMIYVLYNALICAMLLANEISGFTKARKSLRVSPPRRGIQRSSYYLTAPYRYSLALLVGITVLHWFISQSLFILRIDTVQFDGSLVYNWNIGYGFSPTAIVASMAWGAAMILYAIVLGLHKLPQGIPLMAHNSLAISAACHPDKLEPADGSQQSLMYGVLPTLGRDGRRRVGFSSLAVEPLRDGEIYEKTKCAFALVGRSLHAQWGEHVCGEFDPSFWRTDGQATYGQDPIDWFKRGCRQSSEELFRREHADRQIVSQKPLPPVPPLT